MSTQFARAAFAAAALALPLTACGGGSSTSASNSGSTASGSADVKIVASSLAYTQSAFTAKAGDFTIELDNRDPVAHNVTLENGQKLLVQADPNKAKTATITLAAGTYQLYCSVPGHNMHATLTLQ